MTSHIVSSHFRVAGVRTDADVKRALQSLYDIFSDHGLGQATFEVTDAQTADLFIKHQDTVVPDRTAIAAALSAAGGFRLVD